MFEVIEEKPVKKPAPHTTEKEIEFLDGIVAGTNAPYPRNEAAKIKALEGYIRGAAKRVTWDLTDSAAVISHAYRLLDGLKAA